MRKETTRINRSQCFAQVHLTSHPYGKKLGCARELHLDSECTLKKKTENGAIALTTYFLSNREHQQPQDTSRLDVIPARCLAFHHHKTTKMPYILPGFSELLTDRLRIKRSSDSVIITISKVLYDNTSDSIEDNFYMIFTNK